MHEINSSTSKKSIQEVIDTVPSEFRVEAVTDPNSPRVHEVAALDARLFGEHKSLPVESFQAILESGGAVLGHVDDSGALISEASIILDAVEAGECSLERELPSWLAYCDGAAVATEYRGRGLQKQLLTAREAVAVEVGKEAASASVRQKNVASIRSMLSKGYVMISDAPQYYGPSPEDDRVIMLHDFETGNPFKELDTEHTLLEQSLRGIISPQDVSSRVSEKQTLYRSLLRKVMQLIPSITMQLQHYFLTDTSVLLVVISMSVTVMGLQHMH